MSYCLEKIPLPESCERSPSHHNQPCSPSKSSLTVEDCLKNNQFPNIFEPFISVVDHEAEIHFNKLDDMLRQEDRSIFPGLRTKDPILDVFHEILRLYGLKIHFIYQNIENDLYFLKGVKTVHGLHDCLGRLARTLRLFPCSFIKSLDLSLILCEGLEIKEKGLKSSDQAFAEAIILEKNAINEEVLQKHFVKIVFANFLRVKFLGQENGSGSFDFKQMLKSFSAIVHNKGCVDAKTLRSEHGARFVQIFGYHL